MRPHTGNKNIEKYTYEVLDPIQGNQRMSSIANSKEFQETDSKFGSLLNIKNKTIEEALVNNTDYLHDILPNYSSKNNNFTEAHEKFQKDSVPRNLLQKIGSADNKAMISYNVNQERVEQGRKQMVRLKTRVESEKIASKMHKKVLSWQNRHLNFD